MADQRDPVAKKFRERAERVTGPVPRVVRQGQVWTVPDALIVLPEERLHDGPRKLHDERYVIVLQESATLTTTSQETVLVVPCSASEPPGPFDVEFEDQPNGFSKAGIVAFASLVQPILLTDLARRTGTVEDECLIQIGLKLLQLFGMESISRMFPRD